MIILIGMIYIIFLIYTIIMGKKSQNEEILEISLEDSKKIKVSKNLAFILLGILGYN